MNAIIGKPGVGKTLLLTKLSKEGYSTFNTDLWFEEQYNNSKSKCFLALVQNFGNSVVVDNKISKKILKKMIQNDFKILQKIEGLLHPILFDHLLKNNYNFVEIPILEYSIIDFSKLFHNIYRIKPSIGISYRVHVDNFIETLISLKNRDIRNLKVVDISIKKALNSNFF